jgi:enoyl-CoA hydratase/carnithine racemase
MIDPEEARMKFIKVLHKKEIAVVKMKRGKVNALNPEILHELHDAFDKLEKDKNTQVVLFTGHGKFFSFGLDVPELLTYSREKFTGFLADFTNLYTKMFVFPKPLIGVINGHAIAGGCMLALACDRRIMVMGNAKISLNEVTFGASVFAGSVEMLKSCVGHRNGERILYSGYMYDCEEALLMGLVDRMTTEEELDDTARDAARDFIKNDLKAFRAIKLLLRSPVAENMRSREEESIKEFVKVWYSDSTQKQLKEIKIKK